MLATLKPKKRDTEKILHNQRHAAARHPGVKEFTSIVVDALALRKRIVGWLDANDSEPGEDFQTKTVAALDAATRSDSWPDESNVPDFMRELYFLERSIYHATEDIRSQLYSDVMPEAFPRT